MLRQCGCRLIELGLPGSLVATICLGELLEALFALAAGIRLERRAHELRELRIASCFIWCFLNLEERLAATCVVETGVEAEDKQSYAQKRKSEPELRKHDIEKATVTPHAERFLKFRKLPGACVSATKIFPSVCLAACLPPCLSLSA